MRGTLSISFCGLTQNIMDAQRLYHIGKADISLNRRRRDTILTSDSGPADKSNRATAQSAAALFPFVFVSTTTIPCHSKSLRKRPDDVFRKAGCFFIGNRMALQEHFRTGLMSPQTIMSAEYKGIRRLWSGKYPLFRSVFLLAAVWLIRKSHFDNTCFKGR